MLLDLVPVEFVTNTSVTFSEHEAVMSKAFDLSGEPNSGIGQHFSRLAWKKPIRQSDTSIPQRWKENNAKITFDSTQLGELLYSIYLKCFR